MKKPRMTFLIASFVGALCLACVAWAGDGSPKPGTNQELNTPEFGQQWSFSKDIGHLKRRGRQHRHDATLDPQSDDDSTEGKSKGKKKRGRGGKHNKKHHDESPDDEFPDDESPDEDEDGDVTPTSN